MEFNQRITIIGRISDIDLEQFAVIDSYLPGTYFTRYMYTDGHGNMWWLDKETMISVSYEITPEMKKANEDKGSMWRDWQVIPEGIVDEIRKQWDNQN